MKSTFNIFKFLSFQKILYALVLVFLFLYVFSLPSFGESESFTIYLVYSSMAILAAASFLYCFLYKNLKIRKAHLLLPFFVIISFIGTALYSHHYRQWITLIFLTISFFGCYYAFKSLKNKFTIVSIITFAFFVFSLYYIFHYRSKILDYRSYTNSDFRLGWDFDNPNGVGIYATIGVATSLYLLLFWNKKIRFLCIVPVLTSLLVGLTTGSRTFLIVVLLMLLTFLYFKFKSHKIAYLIVVFSVIGLFVILLFLPFMQTLRDRLLQAIGTWFGTQRKADTSTIERTVWLDYGFYLGAKNIIFGYGVDGFSIFSGVGTYTHSNFSEVFCDFGVIGLIVFYAPLFVVLYRAFKNKKIDKSLVIPLFILYIITSFSSVFYYKKIYYLVLSFLFYLVYIDGCAPQKHKFIKSLRKVVFTCDSMGSGGAEKVISLISNEMSRRGINVFIIGVADPNEPKSFYHLGRNVKYQTCSNGSGKPLAPMKRVIKLRKMFKELEPDIVISFLPNANIYTWLSLINTKVPYIVSERNNPRKNPKNVLTRFLKKLSFYASNGVVFQTLESQSYYSKKIKNKSIIIKNPIALDCDKFTYSSKRDKVVLSVGRLVNQKNYPCLLQAFKIFNGQFNNEYVLRIYGDGPLKEQLLGLCNLYGICDYVYFLGVDSAWHSKEIYDSVYVLSSDYEGFPNALAEAIALGIPSVATDCPSGGPRELIENGVNGYLSPVNDIEALSKNMVKIVSEPYDKYIDAASIMRTKYSSETIVSAWISYILNLEKNIYE